MNLEPLFLADRLLGRSRVEPRQYTCRRAQIHAWQRAILHRLLKERVEKHLLTVTRCEH